MSTTTVTAPRQAATAAPGDAQKPTPRRGNGVWSWIWYGVSAGLLGVVLAIGVAAIALPRFTGAVPLTVLSGSMEPALPTGTLLVVRPLAQDQLREIHIGDVISYQPNPNDPMLVTHRVIGITSMQDGGFVFTVKGDANSEPDAPVQGIQVRAVLWYAIPGLGWVNDAVNSRDHRAWIVPTAAGLLFAYTGYTVAAAGASAAKKRKEQTAAEQTQLESAENPGTIEDGEEHADVADRTAEHDSAPAP